jgi:hypothetical protein
LTLTRSKAALVMGPREYITAIVLVVGRYLDCSNTPPLSYRSLSCYPTTKMSLDNNYSSLPCVKKQNFSTISANMFNRSTLLMRDMKLLSLKSIEEIVHNYSYLNDVGAAADSN